MVNFLKKYYFHLLILTGVLIGSILRLYRIGSQIIWDDEWHAVNIALFNPLKYIVTHFHWDYNSIPLTVYFRIMLELIGLNELIIRLPQLLSGILMLVIFPLVIKRIFDKRVAIIFLFLLAICPLLIYFSRIALAYSTVVFLSFTAIFSFYLWMKEGRAVFVLIYLVCAVLAPYFHISSAAFVSAPILYVIVLSLFKKGESVISFGKYIPPKKHLFFITTVLMAGISVWLFPLIRSLDPVIRHSGEGFVDFGTLGGCASLFCGTNSPIILVVLTALFGYGSYFLYCTDKLLFSFLFAIGVCQILMIALSRPFLVQNSMIFTRYFLPFLPIWLLIIAVALNELHTKLVSRLQNKPKIARAFSNAMLVGFLLIIFLKGAIPDVYSFPNDFTNHKDFQYNYLYLDDVLKRADRSEGGYPEFYSNLANLDKETVIVEFPGVISWTWNIFHVYQRLHRNRVIVGYDSNEFGPFFGYDAFRNRNVRFSNFIDISDAKVLFDSGADFVVLHKNMWKECATMGLFSGETRRKMESRVSTLSVSLRDGMRKYVSRAIGNQEKVFGKPFYEDSWIIVYKIE